MEFLIISVLLIIFGVCSYCYFLYIFNHWKKRNMEFIRPCYPFGSFSIMDAFKYPFSEIIKNMYDRIKGRYGGFYILNFPLLILKDPEIIKQLLVKDNDFFNDRGFRLNYDHDPFAFTLLTSSCGVWKTLRQKLAPTFAPNRLKCLLETAKTLLTEVKTFIDRPNSEKLDIMEIMRRFNLTLIASEAYGIDMDIINGDSDLSNIIKIGGEQSWMNCLRIASSFFTPTLSDIFHIDLFDPACKRHTIELFKKTMKYREENNIVQKDFVQILINLYKMDKTLSIAKIAAQPFAFALAATETMTMTISYCLFELSCRPDLQRKAQVNIDEILQKYDGQLTYESIKEMKFAEYCIDETLRIHPVLPVLVRTCISDYKMPDSDFIVRKGDNLLVSIQGLHMDSKYFENPTVFDPDRFYPKRRSANAGCYLPFGVGPRFCFGKLYAKIITQLTLCSLLSKYNFELAMGMPSKLTFRKIAPLHIPSKNIYLKVVPRL